MAQQPELAFTVEHFKDWASELVLDTGEFWEPRDFQLAFVEDLFGPYQVIWLIVPEGNGKSTLLAGICLYFLEFLPRASVPVAAKSREQAEIIYKQAETFVISTPKLHEMVPDELRIIRGKRAMDVPRNICLNGHRRINHFRGGVVQIRAADENTQDGIIPNGLGCIDELHRFPQLGLYHTWRGKLIKRGAKLVVISTAGEPGGEFETLRETIRQSAADITRGETFVRAAGKAVVLHEWAVPEGGDVEDLELVSHANPLLTLRQIQEKRDAEDFNLAHWRRFTCNLPTRSEFAAIQEKEWFDAEIDEWPNGERTWLGLDMGWKRDTTSAVQMYVRDPEYRLLGPTRVLTPPRDGTSLDVDLVKRTLVELYEQNPFHTVVMDTSDSNDIAQWISDEFPGVMVVDRQQTNPLAVQDYERFMEALRNGWLHHTGDPMLTRHVLNAIARVLPRGDARFDRPHQSRLGQQDMRVIDALSAASMVHSVAHAELTMAGGLVY